MSDNEDNKDKLSPQPIKGSIDERFGVFVQEFISNFVDKYADYRTIAKPGGKRHVGKTTENVLETAENATRYSYIPVKIVVKAITSLTRFLLAVRNKNKATSTTKYEYAAKDLIKVLKKVAVQIFCHYEYQFVNISENWRFGIEYMSIQAVKRSFNYYAEHAHESEDISELFIKGIVLGKDNFAWVKNILGDKIYFKGTAVRPPTLYGDSGMCLTHNGNIYYKRKGQGKPKYGYRRIFRWESMNDYMLMDSVAEEDKYDYKLNEDDLEKKLRKFNFGDMIEKLKIVLQEFEEIHFVSFQEKDPIDPFVGRKDELVELGRQIQDIKDSVVKSITCVTGIRGIGKTELVRKYSWISENRALYDDNIIWIDAENQTSLMDSFKRLARELSIEYSADDLVKNVYKYFAKKKCLIIFDNANGLESADGIYKFLPENKRIVPGVYIVVTSYNKSWDNCKIVDLKRFDSKESAEFFKLKEIRFETDVDIKQLIHTLEYIPLALDQCAAYIKNQESNMIIRKCTLENYLEKYKQEKEALLKFKSGYNYSKTIFCNYSLLIEKMETFPDIGTTAKLVLEIIAYFSADYIPVELFCNEKLADLESLNEVFKLLVRYSIITLNEHRNLFKVNRVIQEIIKSRLENKKEEKFELFGRIFELLENFKEDYDQLLLLYPHFQNILNCLDGMEGKNIGRFRKFILESEMNIIDVDEITDIQNKLDQDYNLAKEIYGDNSFEFVNMLKKHSLIYARLENYNKQMELIEQALHISQEMLFPSEHIEIYKIKLNLGIAYLNNSNFVQSIEIMESVLIKFKTEFGNDSYEVAVVLNNLSNVYTGLSDHKKARDLLLQSLKIFENVFGNDHIMLYCVLVSLMGTYKLLGDNENEKLIEERISKSRYIQMNKQFKTK